MKSSVQLGGNPEALPTFFDEVGGQATFDRLTSAFYERVRRDEVLWPMYPQDDLDGAIWRLSHFLAQYFEGPSTYSQERGHPRLRMRHHAFRVNPDARDRWLRHMTDALNELCAAPDSRISPMHRLTMLEYFDRAAHAMVNTFDASPQPPERA
ncbi:globin [Pseudoclavibacter endophyticus]|uniref:Globin n=1 Tax=Pseudoclavibacter endophyticus TaxID=1778590 RepID=A0A6H9WNA4_9MICO|nr:globin [Pseudoclavibacter endophyticus]KAB1646725.1 globin [Pseudoclavibacter endophyticus]GGA76080.1 globin [Pseudoclavibacter endophyticus]